MREGDKEHLAFEEFGAKENLNMEMHPLHLLYLDSQTASSLRAFKAGYAAATSPRTYEQGAGDTRVRILDAVDDLCENYKNKKYGEYNTREVECCEVIMRAIRALPTSEEGSGGEVLPNQRGFTAEEADAYSEYQRDIFNDGGEVCEWTRHSEKVCTSKCNPRPLLVLRSGYKFCPYCGKPINLKE